MLATIEGPMGSGKTASATMIALQDFQEGRQIFSNFWLAFTHTTFDQELFFRMNEEDFQLNNCTILADEAYLYMDSRNSMSSLNRTLHYYAMQTRKRNVDMYLTTQSYKKIDRRIREAVTMRIRCRFSPRVYLNSEGKPYKGRKALGEEPMMTLNPNTGLWEPAVAKPAEVILLIRRLDSGGKPVRRKYNVEKVFDLYNTNEVVKVPDKLVNLGS